MTITVPVQMPVEVQRALDRASDIPLDEVLDGEGESFKQEALTGWIVGVLYAVLQGHGEHDAAAALVRANGIEL